MKIVFKLLLSIVAFIITGLMVGGLSAIGSDKTAFIRLIPGFFFIISLILIWRKNSKELQQK